MSIDTFNKFIVGVMGPDRLMIMNPPRGHISRDEALLLAAYLVTLSAVPREDFLAVLDAVEST